MTARVLGTRFLVRRYASDPATTGAVREGKVAVRSVVLTAAPQAQVGDDGIPHVHPARASQFTFVTGPLMLDGVPLPSAIPDVNRWYDADIRLGSRGLAARYVKGECAAGALADLQEILEFTFDVRVARHGRTLILYAR